MPADRPKPARVYMLVGALSVALSVATLVLVFEKSGDAIATGLLAAACAFSLPRLARR